MPRDLRHSLRSDLAGSAFGQPGEVSNSTRMIASIASPPVGCLVGSGHVVCTCSATATGPDPDRPHSSASDAPPATLSTKSPQTETRPQPRSMWDNRTVLGFATKTGKTPSPPLPESRQLRSSGSWAFANQKRNLQLGCGFGVGGLVKVSVNVGHWAVRNRCDELRRPQLLQRAIPPPGEGMWVRC